MKLIFHATAQRNAKNTKDFAPLRETKMPDRVLKVQECPRRDSFGEWNFNSW